MLLQHYGLQGFKEGQRWERFVSTLLEEGYSANEIYGSIQVLLRKYTPPEWESLGVDRAMSYMRGILKQERFEQDIKAHHERLINAHPKSRLL